MNFVVSWLTLHCLPQECYVHNLLRVTVYIPSIRRDILDLIIGKMLQLDVSNSKSCTIWITSTAEWKKKKCGAFQVSASRSEIEDTEYIAMQNLQAHHQKEEGLFDMVLTSCIFWSSRLNLIC